MTKIQKLKIVIILSIFYFLFSGISVFAAEVFFEQEKNLGLKDQFRMGIFLKTEEPLNAIEGKINFPADLLELKNVEDGNSVINLWLERPTVSGLGEITFSGITPGGYQGSRGLIFSMTFLVRQEGVGLFDIHNIRLLRNDSKGTEAKLQTFSSKFVISKKTTEVPVPVSKIEDIDTPESFMPEIARDESISGGKWFVVFAAQDKGLGIDHYEIKESRQKILTFFSTPLEANRLWQLPIRGWIGFLTGSRWTIAKSPYVLEDQELRSYVFVKAVDKASNERIAKINPQNPLGWYENYENWIIIITVILFAFIMFKILWRKH